MESEIDRLLKQLSEIEEQVERTIETRRAEFQYRLKKGRVVFEQKVIARHRGIKTGLFRFLRSSPLTALLTAPVIYLLIFPLALLDLGICLYQFICFPVWGIARVRRSDYVVIDRHHLAYLNGVQKLNCLYCEYANGLIAFVREVASRSEQYWCPIKHAKHIKKPHERYRQFLDYGDAEGFRDRLGGFRDQLRKSRSR